MRFLLGGLVLVFNLADNATTFLCLSASTPGFEVFEANPVAAWTFETLGLASGLLLETLVTTAAVAFLIFTERVPARMKLALLGLLSLLPAWAAVNNLQVAWDVGLI
jgi:hypothetical protein